MSEDLGSFQTKRRAGCSGRSLRGVRIHSMLRQIGIVGNMFWPGAEKAKVKLLNMQGLMQDR